MVRWNLTGEGTKAMLYARNIGNRLRTLMGGNGYSAVITPAFDIDAANLSILSRGLRVIRYSFA
jgi:hypothetical protein